MKEGKKLFSIAGNRTPVSCVTGGNTGHCTTTDALCCYTLVYIPSLGIAEGGGEKCLCRLYGHSAFHFH